MGMNIFRRKTVEEKLAAITQESVRVNREGRRATSLLADLEKRLDAAEINIPIVHIPLGKYYEMDYLQGDGRWGFRIGDFWNKSILLTDASIDIRIMAAKNIDKITSAILKRLRAVK